MRLVLFVASLATVIAATRETSTDSVTLPDLVRLGEATARLCLTDAVLRAPCVEALMAATGEAATPSEERRRRKRGRSAACAVSAGRTLFDDADERRPATLLLVGVVSSRAL